MANYTRELDLIYLSLNKKYRGHIEIIGLILEALKYSDAARYSLMKHTNMNYSQLKKYLKLLGKIGFIETNIREGKIFYKSSEMGLTFLRQYYVLQGMLLNACTRNNSFNAINEKYNLSNLQHAPMPFATQIAKQK